MKHKGENKALRWTRLLKQRQEKRLIHCLQRASPIEVASFLEKQPYEVAMRLFFVFSNEIQGEVFSLFHDDLLQMQLYSSLSKSAFAKIFSCMPSDLRVDFYQRLSSKEHAHLLPYLSKKVREDVIMLNAYSPDTAGGIMNTDFATVLDFMTVEEAIAKIRQDAPSKKMLYYIYVVNANMKLVGFVSLKDLVMHEPNEQIGHMLHTDVIYATVDEDQEAVAKRIEQYGLVAIPILNQEKQIVGIVSHDDAIDIIRAEQTEDMDTFMGITSEEDAPHYLKTSTIQHVKKRINWVIMVFMLSTFAQYFEHKHHDTFMLNNFIFYLSMITDTGGNVGSQAASVVLQALNRGQVTLTDWIKIIGKEFKISILMASILFMGTYIKLFILDLLLIKRGNMHGDYEVMVIVACSIVLQVIISTFIGAFLPLAAKFFKGDPAVAANPTVNTLVELLGTVIYFFVIRYWLSIHATHLPFIKFKFNGE